MATVTEKISEALVGTSEEPQLTLQTRGEFMKHAITDAETGEHYLDEERFINAIAPVSEDYVGLPFTFTCQSAVVNQRGSHLAQDQARAVFHPFPSRR